MVSGVNDLFIGPKTHCSARYLIRSGEASETQSSSGVIVSTGMGSTGWLKSLLTGAAAINGTGNEFDNVLHGNIVGNRLAGGKGNDLIYGEGGNDTLVGEQGDDRYFIDGSADVVTESANSGIDTVVSENSYVLAANIENLELSGTAGASATGNTLANKLLGTSGGDSLDGKLGADTMKGGAGNDTYVVDNAKDIVDENGGNGTDKVQSTISYVLGLGLEQLALLGSGAINGTGNDTANLLAGNTGANKLDGKAGADTMEGGGGNDIYLVDDLGDNVVETQGGSTGGTDLVLSAITFDLSQVGREQVENLTLTGAATDNVDAIGNGLANILTGNAADNLLDGRGGADKMAGGLGNDIYVADLKTDTVTEATDAGTDTVRSSLSYVLGANLENLELLGAALNGTGNASNNKLVGDDLVVEVEEVRARSGYLGRDHVHDEDGLARILPAPEGVDVGDVGRRVERDERRLPVAGRPAEGRAAEHHQGGERRRGDAGSGWQSAWSHHLVSLSP
jgi:Ca2+-binding RTX toxin-like protein